MRRQRSLSDDRVSAAKKQRTDVDDPGNNFQNVSLEQVGSSCVTPSPRGKSIYAEYFEIMYIKGIKFGYCKTCGKNEKGKFKVGFKMTKHNTTSLRNHMKSLHPSIFEKVLMKGTIDSQPKDLRKVKLDQFFTVSCLYKCNVCLRLRHWVKITDFHI